MSDQPNLATRQDVINWCLENGITFRVGDIAKKPPYGWVWFHPRGQDLIILQCQLEGYENIQVTAEDLVGTACLGQEIQMASEDAGTRAREKLMVRAKRKAKRILVWTIVLLLAVLAAAIAGIVYWASQNIHTGYAMVEKQCGIQVGDVTLKGVREYGYRYYEVLGARMNFTRDVKETTVLMPEGSPMMIIGATATEWWGLPVDAGEQRRQLLKPANSYTFVIGKKANVVDYEGFCKPHPIGDDGSEQVAKADTKPTKK